jgi:hypothetical protein
MQMFPIDRLLSEHRKHYRAGTLDDFRKWFERSGFGDMLGNPFLNSIETKEVELTAESVPFAALQALSYRNTSAAPAAISLQVHLERGAKDVRQLFENFVRCTGHTHLAGDFRKYCGFYSGSYTGARYVLFDGAGTCLLLGAMFQALAKKFYNEEVALHYSHTSNRELTHVFASWNGFFVDPDQKTWVPLTDIDDSAVFGYLFQQLGVSAYQVFLSIDPDKRRKLFSRMALDYFKFYDDSRTQYMYQADQSIQTVSHFFKQAREKHCTDLDVYATDFPWKAELRAQAARHDIDVPYFLANVATPASIEIPAGGSFEIGLRAEGLPIEASQLASIFLSRVPATLSLPIVDEHLKIDLPEFPWLLVFTPELKQVTINEKTFAPWLSECGKYRLLGMGELETVFDMASGNSSFSLDIQAAATQCSVVLPINAFALTAGLIDITPGAEADFEIRGRVV